MLTMKDIIREGNPTLRTVCDEVSVPLTAEDIQLGKDMLEFYIIAKILKWLKNMNYVVVLVWLPPN